MTQKVLLVEDDPMIGEAVCGALSEAHIDAQWAKSGWEAMGFLAEDSFGLVLLDLGLPGRDGMSVLRDMRAKGNLTPVIILTARDGLEDRLAGLDAGADDYVLKPFHMSEVLARMRAVLRRRGAGLEHNGVGSKTLTNGELTLDCEMKTVRVRRDGQSKEVALSRREYDVLEALLQRPGAILSRSALEDRVYVDGELPESNAI